MHTEIKTPTEAQITLSEHFFLMAKRARELRLLAHKREKEWRKKALSLLEIPVVKLP